MKNFSVTLVGLLALLAGAFGVYHLFTNSPADVEEAEESIETLVPVHAGKILRTTLRGYEVEYGNIEAAPLGKDTPPARVTLHFAVDGVLTEIACQPGRAVKKGDLLFRLDSRLVEATINEKRQSLDFARKEQARQEQLLKIQGTSEREYQQAARDFDQAEQALAAARVQLEYYTLRAPISGTVLSVKPVVGETVQAAQVLAEILNPTHRIVSVQVSARLIDRIQRGQPIQVSSEQTDSSAAWLPAGHVNYIGEEVDPRGGTIEIRADLLSSSTLRIGQFVKTRILYDSHPNCLAVPASALVTGPDGDSYIAVISDERAHRISVSRKFREGRLIEIEGAGLTAGMDIVTDGAYGLPEQTRIEVIGQ